MLTPSAIGSTSKAHDVYNYFLSQLRITIERSFGILNTVFAIWQKPLKFEVAKCVKVCEPQPSSAVFNHLVSRWFKCACDYTTGESTEAARK
jgi:hypothetical protein